MIKKRSIKTIILWTFCIGLPLIIVAFFIIKMNMTSAWLTDEVAMDFDSEYSNYTAKCNVVFKQGNATETPITAFLDSDKLIKVAPYTSTELNYIEKLKASVTYQGKSQAYIRVKVTDEWSYDEASGTQTIRSILPNTALLKYNLKPNWIDNRKSDGYFYYKYPIGGVVDTSTNKADDTPIILEFFDGLKENSYVPDVMYKAVNLEVRFAFSVEAVQVNRISAFWGENIAILVGANSATSQVLP